MRVVLSGMTGTIQNIIVVFPGGSVYRLLWLIPLRHRLTKRRVMVLQVVVRRIGRVRGMRKVGGKGTRLVFVKYKVDSGIRRHLRGVQ